MTQPDSPETQAQAAEAASRAPEDAAAQAGAADNAAADLSAILAELESAKAESARHRDHYLRAMADFDTYRRRTQRDLADARSQASGKLLEDFIPVYDAIKMALVSVGEAPELAQLRQGMGMVLQQFRSALEKNQIQEIDPEPGVDFDPHQHESLTHQPSPSVPADKVLWVTRVGFRSGNRLIRAASVVLSAGPSA